MFFWCKQISDYKVFKLIFFQEDSDDVRSQRSHSSASSRNLSAAANKVADQVAARVEQILLLQHKELSDEQSPNLVELSPESGNSELPDQATEQRQNLKSPEVDCYLVIDYLFCFLPVFYFIFCVFTKNFCAPKNFADFSKLFTQVI